MRTVCPGEVVLYYESEIFPVSWILLPFIMPLLLPLIRINMAITNPQVDI